MRLLILTQKVDSTDDNLGFFHRWIEEFAKRCESVLVICLYEGAHDLPSNVCVMSLGKEAGVSRLKYLRRFYSYVWRERKNYDAVFVHMNQIYVILGGLIWRALGKHIGLWYAHGTASLTLRLATLFTDDVFTSTEEGFRIVTKKKRVVGQGIDAAMFDQKQAYDINGPLRIVTSGRLTPAKDIEGMMDIIGKLKERGVVAILDLIGTGEPTYTEHLIRYAKEKGLDEQVVFRGGMPYGELVRTLSRYDAFLNLGRTGSLDKALLDAAAAGLPIVTTNRTFPQSAGVHPLHALEDLVHMDIRARRILGNDFQKWVQLEHSLSRLIRKIILTLEKKVVA